MLASRPSAAARPASASPASQRGGVVAAHAVVAPAAAAASASQAPSPAAREVLFGKGAEQAAEVPARVVGVLPPWLSGCLLVNGGGDYSRMSHMFDGYAAVTKVRVSGGEAWGSQRFLGTKAFAAYQAEGRVVYREFATPPEVSGLLGQAKELASQVAGLVGNNPIFTDNASVSLQAVVAGPGGRRVLLAMSETPAASYLVDPADLSTLQQVGYADAVPGNLTTAHPTVLSDGSLLNFARTLPAGGFHIYRQDPATLKRTEVAFVPDRRPMSPAWLHDFGATDKWAVIIEHPLYMSLTALLFNTPCSHIFMDWAPQDETRVTLVALDGSKVVRSFSCPPFFFFHVGNCFESEDGASLCVDLAAYEDPQIIHDLSLQPLRSPKTGPQGELQQQVSKSWYKRLTIPLTGEGGGRLQAPQQLLVEQPGEFCEFPAINPAFRFKPNRYVYCLSAARPTNLGNALSKLDLADGSSKTWHMPGGAVGEPVFVASPGSSSEDDGVVVAPGVDGNGTGFMLVLDAASWQELARVELPFGVPNRFHGLWLGDEA